MRSGDDTIQGSLFAPRSSRSSTFDTMAKTAPARAPARTPAKTTQPQAAAKLDVGTRAKPATPHRSLLA